MADGIAVAAEQSGAVALAEEPALMLVEPAKFDAFYDAIAQEARGLKADTSTKKGREAIASMAFKVARTKTAIDDAGKKLNEEARSRIAVVDAARRQVRERLDALRDEVRAPLTAWEDAEAARLARVDAAMKRLQNAARIDLDDTAETVATRIAEVEAVVITEAEFQGETDTALALQSTTIEGLRRGHARLVREEAERAELARLRAAQAEREAQERAERERQEAERRRREEEEQQAADAAAQAERERQAIARAEQERQEALARAAREAEERARREAEDRARAEQEERERAHREEVARERRGREEAEATARAERLQRANEEAAREAAARREQEEAARRAADREHRAAVMRTAKEALMEHAFLTEPGAKAVVLAIAAGSVPAVTIRF